MSCKIFANGFELCVLHSTGKPIMIISEYMENGSLDVFLRVRVMLDQCCIRRSFLSFFLLEMKVCNLTQCVYRCERINVHFKPNTYIIYCEVSGIWISDSTL